MYAVCMLYVRGYPGAWDVLYWKNLMMPGVQTLTAWETGRVDADPGSPG